MLRVPIECQSFLVGGSGVTQIREFGPGPAIAAGEKALITGGASEAVRLAAYARSYEKCARLYELRQLTGEEASRFRMLPSVKKYAEVGAELRKAKNFERPETRAALDLAISEPMLGLLSSLTLELDLQDLSKSYPEETVGPGLETMVMMLVLCKMGDDCDRGGIVTDQLCWAFAICGDRVEDAIRASLVQRGIDPVPLDQFVNRIAERLHARDTTIFRKKE